MHHRLFRSSDHRIIGGVAGGLAEYFQTDPLLIRIIFLILIPAGGIIIYPLLWAMIPEKDNNHTLADEINQRMSRNHNHANGIFGLLFIILGAILLADSLFPSYDFIRFWPILLIIFGALIMIRHHDHTS